MSNLRWAVLLGWIGVLSACGSLARDAARAPSGAAASNGSPSMLRLPADVRPLSYGLELSVLPAQARFTGRTQITVDVRAPTARVWLHGKDLRVTGVRALVAGEALSGTYRQENADGLASVQFERALPVGTQRLEFRYDAPFNRQLQGLYRVDTQGRSYAFTQFEPIAARQAFPCFDEPGFKTPFDLWLTVAEEDVAVANTEPVSEEHSGPYKRIHFDQTKPLPTYLVAWAVGPLAVVETAPLSPTANRAAMVPLRGIATHGRGPLLDTALSMLAPTLGALESKFGIGYPYDKLDLVAVPDFSAGAMENAGLITFRDSLLLLDPARATENERRRTAFVLAHELAHQWFGNLVTMQFWNDVWLNEAFATWLESRVMARLHPEYNGELELVRGMNDAMSNDSRVTARMVRQPIESTHDIVNAFDSITYSKGAGLIAMFERFVGPELFTQGLRDYLNQHAFGNATTEDLLAALSRAAGRDVTQPFMTFLTQPGVPLLETQVDCQEGQPARLKLHQSRYLPLGSTGEPRQTWQIPVCARYASAGIVRESCGLLQKAEGTLQLEGGCPSWILPNADGAGYYYFTQAGADLDRLRQEGIGQLSARERYALLQSLIAGVAADAVSANVLLPLLPLFASDDERLIATIPLNYLRTLRDHWLARPDLAPGMRIVLEAKFGSFVRGMYASSAQQLGLVAQKRESGDTRILRAQVIAGMCDLANDPALRATMARLGRQYLGLDSDGELHPQVLPAELSDLAVRMLVEQGDAATFDSVYQRFLRADDASERARYLYALGAVRDERADKALALSVDPALRVNEVFIPLRQQLGDYRTRARAQQYLEDHFEALGQRVAPSMLASVPWLLAGSCDQAQAARIHAFFAARIESLPGGPRSLGGALEAIGLCDAMFKAQTAALDAYFAKL